MCNLNVFRVFVVLSVFYVTVVNCSKPVNYCDKKYEDQCKANNMNDHIGCTNGTSVKVGVPDKLVKNDRVALVKYFNTIRNEIVKIHNISNMNELSWSDEYEHLAEKAIENLNMIYSGCYWTESSKVFPSELNIVKTAINHNGTWLVTVTTGVSTEKRAEQPPLTDHEFQNLNKINYLLDEEKAVIMDATYSQFHDPISNRIGCAWSSTPTPNSTYIIRQIRCIINARLTYNRDHFEFGKPCTKCGLKSNCSKEFKNLCSSSDKLGLSFILMYFMIFIGIGKYFK